MQAKKAKQLLKARLARERQIYEMRKRAELKAAVSELERPWEVVEKAPKLFSARADEQVQVLADRFQKPGGFDLWSENDGPELFKSVDGFPSARFFPKGVVHSIRPYGRVNDEIDDLGGEKRVKVGSLDEFGGEKGVKIGSLDEFGEFGSEKGVKIGSFDEYVGMRNVSSEGRSGEGGKGKVRKKRHGRSLRGLNSGDTNDGGSNGSARVVRKEGSFSRGNLEVRDMGLRDRNNGLDSRRGGYDRENSGRSRVVKKDVSFSKGTSSRKVKSANSEVYDMDLQRDGSYWFKEKK